LIQATKVFEIVVAVDVEHVIDHFTGIVKSILPEVTSGMNSQPEQDGRKLRLYR
jgi:hypothetical protein